MVTLNRYGGKPNGFTSEFYGLSTDVKPTGVYAEGTVTVPILNGSLFYELDTGKLYTYSEETEEWGNADEQPLPLPIAYSVSHLVSSGVVYSIVGNAAQ